MPSEGWVAEMPKYTTVKSTSKGKSATLAKRQRRQEKYAPAATLTRSNRIRTVK